MRSFASGRSSEHALQRSSPHARRNSRRLAFIRNVSQCSLFSLDKLNSGVKLASEPDGGLRRVPTANVRVELALLSAPDGQKQHRRPEVQPYKLSQLSIMY